LLKPVLPAPNNVPAVKIKSSLVTEPVKLALVPLSALPTNVTVVPSSVTALLPIVVELVNLGSVFVVPDTATEVPLVPELPLLPEVPDVPLVPSVPDVPLDPDVPLVPLVPSVPDVPLLPEVPDVPLLPEVPDVPLVPLVPDVPEEPDVPELPTEATDITKFKLVVPKIIGFGVFKIKILSPVVVPELMYV
jgi:hypothetical protein